jgi:hypothetical protein
MKQAFNAVAGSALFMLNPLLALILMAFGLFGVFMEKKRASAGNAPDVPLPGPQPEPEPDPDDDSNDEDDPNGGDKDNKNDPRKRLPGFKFRL